MTAPSTVARAWSTFYAAAPLKPPVTEAEYDELKVLADYLLDNHNIESGPYAALFELLLDYLDKWVRTNEPELKNLQALPREMLAYLMQERSVTQYRLAKDGVVSQGTLNAILKGRRGISKAVAKKLAAYFGVSVELFI